MGPYKVKTKKNWLGATEEVYIVDKSGNKIWSSSQAGVDLSQASRSVGMINSDEWRDMVGRAKSAAQNEINRLESADLEAAGGKKKVSTEELEVNLQNRGGTITEDGQYITPSGTVFASPAEALADMDRVAGLEEDVEKFEQRIKRAGSLREGQAERVSARQQGQLMSNLKRAILGTGGEAGTVSALVPQITEQSERSLQDLIAQSQAKTQEQLAQFVPTEIGAEFNQQQLSDAMQKFLMQESTDRAKFQATLDAQPEWWESVIGGFGQGVGTGLGMAAGASIASDIRIKENISRVGKLDNGLPVYLFNYKGSDIPQIGLMAQDVEKVDQEAVIEINGIKRVYYGKAVQ